jgi:type VII secretion-associated serine protease mycosin
VTRRGLAAGAAAVLACLLTAGGAAADAVRDNEWVLAAVQAQDAWTTTRGAGVTVAVLDSGIDPGHTDLTGQVTTGPDFVGGDARPGDAYWGQHGTSMASTIAGHGHGPAQSAGVIGVAPDARILSVRVTWDNNDPIRNLSSAGQSAAGARPGDPVAQGIRYAVDQGAQVINMSFGEAASSSTRVAESDAAIEYAIAHGVVLVASAGNGAQTDNDTEYPAAFPGVIAVAATDRAGHRATFSTHRWTTSVAAPGVEVLEAQAGGGYVIGDGTSPAAALVSGVAALIRSRYPKLTPAQVRDVLERTASHPAGGYTEDVGWGVVQAAAALRLAATLTPESLTPSPVPAAGHSRLLGGGDSPHVGFATIDARSSVASLGLPVGGLLLTAAVLLATVRRWPWTPRRRMAKSGSD